MWRTLEEYYDDFLLPDNSCATLTGVSFDSDAATLDWTPSYTQAGTYEFKIIADDGRGFEATHFTITVTDANRAPVLASISDQTVNENSATP